VATNRTLVLLRHAKSDWSRDLPDERRPLAGRGRREAPLAGRWLREHQPGIDLVLCSTAVRARQTWRLAGAELDPVPEARYDERLYGAAAGELLAVVRALPAEVGTALLVGHNPGISDLVGLLTGEPTELKTSSIAVLGWTGEWGNAAPGHVTGAAFASPR